MKVTIRIDEVLYRRASDLATRTGRTVSDVIEDAVRRYMDRAASKRSSEEPPALVTFGGSGTMPDVDLAESGKLRDLMDDGEARGSLP